MNEWEKLIISTFVRLPMSSIAKAIEEDYTIRDKQACLIEVLQAQAKAIEWENTAEFKDEVYLAAVKTVTSTIPVEDIVFPADLSDTDLKTIEKEGRTYIGVRCVALFAEEDISIVYVDNTEKERIPF